MGDVECDIGTVGHGNPRRAQGTMALYQDSNILRALWRCSPNAHKEIGVNTHRHNDSITKPDLEDDMFGGFLLGCHNTAPRTMGQHVSCIQRIRSRLLPIRRGPLDSQGISQWRLDAHILPIDGAQSVIIGPRLERRLRGWYGARDSSRFTDLQVNMNIDNFGYICIYIFSSRWKVEVSMLRTRRGFQTYSWISSASTLCHAGFLCLLPVCYEWLQYAESVETELCGTRSHTSFKLVGEQAYTIDVINIEPAEDRPRLPGES